MTLPELQKLSDDDLDERVFLLTGGTKHKSDEDTKWAYRDHNGFENQKVCRACGYHVHACNDGGHDCHSIPAFSQSLDAVHEAEESLIVGRGLEMEYREKLGDVCGQYQIIWHATARQRAIALILTLTPHGE